MAQRCLRFRSDREVCCVWKGEGKNERSCPPLDRIPATLIIMELKKIPGFDETCSANSLQILGRVRL
jgi:hypothetical protein